MSWTRRSVLGAAGAAIGLPLLGRAAAGAPQRKLLVVFANGGWDVLFTVDPKLGLPGFEGPLPDQTGGDNVEELATFGDITITTNAWRRPNVTALFEAHADRICVVNGIWVGSIAHFGARQRVLCGRVDDTLPDLPTILGVARDDGSALGSVDLSGLGRFGPYAPRTARFGTNGQFGALLDPLARPSTPAVVDESWRRFSLDATDRDALAAYRAATDRAGLQAMPRGGQRLAERDEALARADLIRQAAIPGAEIGTTRDAIEVALQLFAGGTCHAAMVASPRSWDTHTGADGQHDRWDDLASDLHWLLDTIDQRGLGDVTVAVLSEMARTPRRNVDGGADHWPHTSALLLGAGITGGRTVGATDDAFHSVPVDLETGEPDAAGAFVRPENLLAGVLETLDVDPEDWLPGVAPLRGFQSQV